MARGAAHDGLVCPTGGLSAGGGVEPPGAVLRHNPGQHAAHLARVERTARVLPGQPPRLGLRTRQSNLIMDGGDHRCPAFHLLRRAHMRGRPARGLACRSGSHAQC